MFGNRLIKSNNAGAACTTDTVQILDGTPLESIATYQLDGAATSIPNNTYPGTFTSPSYATGNFGQAANFTGTNYILTPNFGNISTFTYSFWLNMTSGGGVSNKYIFGKQTFGEGGGGQLYVNVTNRDLLLYANSAIHTWSGSPIIDYDTLTHIVVSVNGGTGTIYLNGVNKGTSSYTGMSLRENYIGTASSDVGNIGNAIVGTVDQVRIFNKALNSTEVETLYNETVATASNSYINVPSCIAYYKMSDATDETGSYDGTPSNVNFNVAGKFGNAGEFNGSSSYINYDILTFPSNDFTFSAWANTNDVSSQYNMITTIAKSGSGRMYFTFEYDKLFYYDPGSTVFLQSSIGSISNNTWYHCVITKSSTEGIKLYLNNTLVDSNPTNTSNPTNGTGQNRIGHYYTPTPIGFFNGKIDQVRIFNRAITANEVETLYDEVQCIPTIVPSEHFNPVIWSADGTSGDIDINSVGFQPDFVWAKVRTQPYSNTLFDSVRGVGSTHMLFSDSGNSESTNTANSSANGFVSSFNINGFTGATGTSANSYFNLTGNDYVAWNWKAGGAAVSNPQGNTASQISANPDSGFSIVTHTSSMLSSQTFGHGLNSTPKIVISKVRNIADSWWVFMPDVIGSTNVLELNATAAARSVGLTFSANDTTFNIQWTSASYDFLHYCFAEVDGFSKFGSYVGTGASGNTVVTGFEPAFLMVKRSNSTGNWCIVDNKRNPTNERNKFLFANEYVAEGNLSAFDTIDFTSNGFILQDAGSLLGSTNININGSTYIFMAFAEEVFVPEIPFEGGDFNGLEYQLVTNPTTGRTWLDRNLGATRVATSQNDSAAFGYYYQWGRLSDGHQIPTSSTTSTLSGGDVPGNSNFITSTVSPKDWRSPQNSSLWQGPQSYNNPCPPGFRLPTEAEILEEAASWSSQNSAGAFASNLKLPTGSGIRIETGGAPVDTGAGYIWTSTISGTDAKFYYVASGGDFTSNYRRAAACPVRPIKDE